MIDTDKYPDGPDDERLIPLSKRELRLMVWAYGCELEGLRKDSSHTDAYTLAEVKRLREENHNRWVVIGKLRRQIKGLQDDLEDWMAGEYHAGSD
tara:strand:+ start:3289 stop:3573 length:285 start_codon:yes stop_codon:yes gene_type:complete